MTSTAPSPRGGDEGDEANGAPGDRPAPAPAGRRRGGLALEVVLLLGSALVIAVVLRAFVAQAFYIPSESMTPQLEVGDRVVVSKLAYDLHDPNRGDVVVFDCPPTAGCGTELEPASAVDRVVRGALESLGLRQPSTEEYIKRVIALPGETVEGRDGRVVVDGRVLEEPYLPPGATTADFGPEVVPDDHLWVMGDNRQNSSDSRFFGAVAEESVVGRALFRVWPPRRLAFL